MFWKGKVGWLIEEGLSSRDSCIEEKAEDGWMDGWQGELKSEGNKDETFEGGLQSMDMTQNRDGEIAVCLISKLL